MSVPKIEELKLLHTKLCSAIVEPRRMQILYALHEQPRHVTALAEELDMPQPTVSRHLSALRQRSLVTSERDGTTVTYSLADPRIIDILEMMRALLRDMLEHQTNALG